mmetsp:Transcript_40890/g.103605  ORF Transcript_40890/g.103605 Transcript_40890/m.103605 type:complete len:119 (-) Transcript_40890:277-633(-)
MTGRIAFASAGLSHAALPGTLPGTQGQVHLPARAKKLAELGLPEPALPNRDLVRHAFKRCAIVGNGPSLAGAQSGRFINQYDAVFRCVTGCEKEEGEHPGFCNDWAEVNLRRLICGRC